MISKPWLVSAPRYRTLNATCNSDADAPGPRCSHTLTAFAPFGTHGPRLILFGGVTAIEASSIPEIRIEGVTNTVHCFDVLTQRWSKIQPAGDPPSPRAAHAAAAVGTMVVFQGGIGTAGHSTDDLFVLDLTNDKFKWHRVVVQGAGPGPLCGHAMDLVAQRYLVTVTGNDGKKVLSDAWALDTAQKPYRWQRLNPEGVKPSARIHKKMLMVCLCIQMGSGSGLLLQGQLHLPDINMLRCLLVLACMLLVVFLGEDDPLKVKVQLPFLILLLVYGWIQTV